jgi:hypothetical protein
MDKRLIIVILALLSLVGIVGLFLHSRQEEQA